MSAFRECVFPLMVSTDLTSRGIDIKNLGFVLNFDFPLELENYVHRIGRTGRMEHKAFSISFVYENELEVLREMSLDF